MYELVHLPKMLRNGRNGYIYHGFIPNMLEKNLDRTGVSTANVELQK